MKIDIRNGAVVLIDKPLGWTSFDVVNKMRYALLKNLHKLLDEPPAGKRKIKVGHAGTLDPLATGLLIVCIGKETKNIDQYMAQEKEYTGSFFLGATTPSYDKETAPDHTFATSHITGELVRQTAARFVGVSDQLPPMFSAIKKDGKKLYESARQGKEVQVDPRKIEIMEFEITGIEMPLVHFRVVCSKGTYIRSLAYDFGKALQSGAYLDALCRTRSGPYQLADAASIEEFVNSLD